jgi:hypothetical protein
MREEFEYTKEQIYDAIDQTLTILENNFRYSYGKKIPFTDIFEMVKDLYLLFNNYENETKKCGKLVIKRFIPLLDLLVVVDNNPNHYEEYTKILKYAYKLGARVSLEHYMVYREWEDKEKFFAPRFRIMQGYIHFLDRIETDPHFELLIANMPSGYGKTYPEKVSEAWSYGIDDTGATLSLCSNDTVVKGGSRTVINEIKSEPFGEVFPHLAYDDKDKNFFLKETDGDWKLKNCKLMSSYNATTTNSNVVGQRASKRVHIDDLYPNYKEAMNKNLNDEYYNNFHTVWKKRFVQEAKFHKIVITGTLWSSDDFIARMIAWAKARYKFEKHPKYPYTLIAKDKEGHIVCAIVQVPALDYETGESVCPELRSTEKVLEDKESIEDYLFQTNFQQIPTDPETLFFSYNRIRTYEQIPETDFKGAYAVIDATRKSGKDFFAMPIMKKVFNDGIFDYYLKDCLFTRTATKDMYEDIVDKIIEHHIVMLVIESNVTSELKENIEKILRERGVTYCIIIEKYNTVPKATRIETEKGVIKKQIVFPKKGMFGINTDMGKFMENLTLYNNSGTNPNDDAPDSLAMFSSEIIEENSQPQKAEPIMGIREFF